MEKDVGQPLVSCDGRMDIVCHNGGQPLLIDVVITGGQTENEQETQRRIRDPWRAVRASEARKRAKYGPNVLAFAVEATGRIGPSAKRLLLRLAVAKDEEPSAAYHRLLAEMQHVVLAGTARMLQGSRGAAPS